MAMDDQASACASYRHRPDEATAAVHFGQEAVKLGAGRGIIRPVHGKNPCPDRMCQGGIIRREIAVERDHGCDLRTGPREIQHGRAAEAITDGARWVVSIGACDTNDLNCARAKATRRRIMERSASRRGIWHCVRQRRLSGGSRRHTYPSAGLRSVALRCPRPCGSRSR